MYTKLSTESQLPALHVKDVLKRFPDYGTPEDVFDDNRRSQIKNYEIRSINPRTRVIELVMTGDSQKQLAAPWEVGRIFIKAPDLLAERIWWI